MMKNFFRGALTALLLAIAPVAANAVVVLNGMPAWWGTSPPESAYFGQAWLDTTLSTDNPVEKIYDGTTWNVVGVCTTACTGAYTIATSTTVPPISPGVCSIASATTTSVAAAGTCPIMAITGTVTITGLGAPIAGVTTRTLVFLGALTFTYGATAIILPKDANITTQIGDVAVVQWVGGTTWRLMSYQTAALFP